MVDYQHVIGVHADVSRRNKRKWMVVEEPCFSKSLLLPVSNDWIIKTNLELLSIIIIIITFLLMLLLIFQEKGGFMDGDQEDVMILVPPLFSPKDVPETLV